MTHASAVSTSELAAVPRASAGNLYGDDLERYAAELAGRPWLWRHLVEHERGRRHYAELFSDEYVTAWLVRWVRDHDTGYHDHDISWGAVAVIAGAVREQRLQADGACCDAVFSAGQSFRFSPLDIHRVSQAGETPAVTLHVYSPPLLAMGTYEHDRNGTLRRRLISAAQELRPATVEPERQPRRAALATPSCARERERPRGRLRRGERTRFRTL